MAEYDMAYYSASGRHTRYSFLAQRYLAGEGFRPGAGESWIAWVEPDPKAELRYTFKWMFDGWYTSLWRSASDRVWVTESQGHVFEFARPDAEYVRHDLQVLLFGIHGFADDQVLAWGERAARPVMFRWDGERWSEMPAPPFMVESMHGASSGDLWIAGGGLAHWDGTAWHTVDVGEPIVSLFVAGPDELYGCGTGGGVFGGTATAWTCIGRIAEAAPGDLQAIAAWKGDLYVAASRLGLYKRIGRTDQFDRYKPKLDAVSIDVREGIVVACKHKVSSSLDGTAFRSTAMEHLLNDRATKGLCEL